jgi:CHAT domain-containing protein
MHRLIAIGICLMVLGLPGVKGYAAEGGASGQTADVPQAKALSEKARELFKVGKYDEALASAKHALQIREKALGPEHPLIAQSLTQMANIAVRWPYHRLWARPWYQRALAIQERTLGPEAPETAASLAGLARFRLWQGNYVQGLPLAQRSLKIREKVFGPDHPETAASLDLLAHYYSQMGSLDQALPLAQRALAIREKVLGPEHPETAASLYTLAILDKQVGSLPQALAAAQRALQIQEQTLGPEHPATIQSLRMVGLVYLDLKDYSRAESYLRRASSFGGKFGLVELYLATGRYDAALALLSSVPFNEWFPPQLKATYYTLKGQALRRQGDGKRAFVAFHEAIQNIEELRARTPGGRTSFFESGLTTNYSQPYREMVGILVNMAKIGKPIPPAFETYETDPAAAAFYYAESIKARALLEAMVVGTGQGSSPLPPDLAARERSLQERIGALEAQREERSSEKGRGWDRAEQPVIEFQLAREALLREQREFAAEVRRRDPRLAALRYPQPLKAKELPLKPGEVLLEYCLGKKESYLFRVEPGGKIQVFRIPLGQEALAKRLGAMLAPFRQSVLRRADLARFSIADAANLYGELLAPALAGVAPGTHLIIVPDGVLGAFPFEALVVQAGPGWDKSVLVGDRWPVTYSQSAAILALNRLLGKSRASKPLFALGDCIYNKNSSRYLAYKAHQGQAGELKHAGPEKALTMAVTGVRGGRLIFPPLPETRKTVEDLAALFGEPVRPPEVLLDVQATETRVRHTPLAQYRYLFFGTHGFLADNLAGVREPTLMLTQVGNQPPDNGFLTFSKVLRLKLDADLVTLAACMTGVGQVMQGEGVLNFARAFQQAGARSVMVSLWNIPVDESMKFYTAFYKALKEGKPKIEALKVARQAVRAKEPHPYFWSGLILHGEG